MIFDGFFNLLRNEDEDALDYILDSLRIQAQRFVKFKKHCIAFNIGTSGASRPTRSLFYYIFMDDQHNLCASTMFVLLWYFMFGVINIGSFFLVDIDAAIRASAAAFCGLIYGSYTWFIDAVLDNGVLMAFRLALQQNVLWRSPRHKISPLQSDSSRLDVTNNGAR